MQQQQTQPAREPCTGLPPRGRWSDSFRLAAAAYGAGLPWVMACGALTAAIQNGLALLPGWGAALSALVLGPVFTLGIRRMYLEMLCGGRPRFRQMLCACKSIKGWAGALTLGLPAVLYQLLASACSYAVAGLEAAGQGQSAAGMSVQALLLALQLAWTFWYPYRLGHLDYIWLTGRAKALPGAAGLSLDRTRGTLWFWAVWFVVYTLLRLACNLLPVLALSGLAGGMGSQAQAAAFLSSAGMMVMVFAQPFLDLTGLAFSACYFGGADKEFASAGGLV